MASRTTCLSRSRLDATGDGDADYDGYFDSRFDDDYDGDLAEVAEVDADETAVIADAAVVVVVVVAGDDEVDC